MHFRICKMMFAFMTDFIIITSAHARCKFKFKKQVKYIIIKISTSSFESLNLTVTAAHSCIDMLVCMLSIFNSRIDRNISVSYWDIKYIWKINSFHFLLIIVSFMIIARVLYFDVNFFKYVVIHFLFIEIDKIDTFWKILLRNYLRSEKFFTFQVIMLCIRLSSEIAEIIIVKCSNDNENETW